MTPDSSGRSSDSAQPPRWAAALLASLLPSSEAETVLGDLIEEYRDAVLPARGRRQANIWFVRQVAGFAWRAPVVWGLVVAALHRGPIRAGYVRPACELCAALLLHDVVIDPAVPARGGLGRAANRAGAHGRARRRLRARHWMERERRHHSRHLRRRDSERRGDAEPLSRHGRLGGAMASAPDAPSLRRGTGFDWRRVRQIAGEAIPDLITTPRISCRRGRSLPIRF